MHAVGVRIDSRDIPASIDARRKSSRKKACRAGARSIEGGEGSTGRQDEAVIHTVRVRINSGDVSSRVDAVGEGSFKRKFRARARACTRGIDGGGERAIGSAYETGKGSICSHIEY